MLTIYGSDLSSPAIKVRLTASYLGIDYKWQVVNLKEGEQKQEWFLKINPVGKIPAIDDDGFHLFESTAICKYLADKHNSSIYPKDLKQHAEVDQWIDFIALHLGVHLSSLAYNRIFAPRLGRPVNEPGLAEATKFLDMYVPIIENRLAQHKYVINGNLSLADIVLFSILEPAELSQFDVAKYPKLNSWRNELKRQPFYTKCYKEYGEMLKAAVAK